MRSSLQDLAIRLFEAGNALTEKVSSKVRDLRTDSSGSVALEYALWAAGISSGTAAAASYVGGEIADVFQLVATTLCVHLQAVCVI